MLVLNSNHNSFLKSLSIYYPKDHYDSNFRAELFDLLKLFISSDSSHSSQIVNDEYGFSITCAVDINSCDFVILPMSWNYYMINNKTDIALNLLEIGKNAGKKVLIWTSGDFGVKIPDFSHVLVLRQSGYRTKLDKRHIGLPVFIEDAFIKYFSEQNLLRRRFEKPKVSFCGQAKGSFLKYAIDWLRVVIHNSKFYLGVSFYEPQTLYPSTLLRFRVLSKLESSKRINSNFIRRKKYRAGAKSLADRRRTELEFYTNIFDSDYVVCARGGGNFSVRFYETLALGRIPILIDTDKILPLNNIIDWSKHCVIVPRNELHLIDKKVCEFHNSLSNTEFSELLLSNRNLWLDYLRNGVFYMKCLNEYNLLE
jgi:hypothetical protein